MQVPEFIKKYIAGMVAIIAVIFLFIFAFFIYPLNFKDNSNPVTANSNSIEQYGIYELTVTDNGNYLNPWRDFNITATFTNGNDSYLIDGFYYENDTWKMRFSPPSSGNWNWVLTTNSASKKSVYSGSFIATPSANPGFVRKSSINPYRLVFDNGSLYNAIGIGDCIYDKDNNSKLDSWGFDGGFRKSKEEGTLTDMPTYMNAYGKNGAGFNLFRWSVDNCAFKLSDQFSPNGNRYLIKEGKLGDDLVLSLRQNGFRTYMVVFGFDPPYLRGNKELTEKEKESIKEYLKYVVARYGAYVDFWEIMNEAPGQKYQEELPKNDHSSNKDSPWTNYVNFAGSYLKSIDPYNHLVSTSWQRPDLLVIDIDSPHWYQKESELESDLVTKDRIQSEKSYKKPIIFGEQGNTVQDWDERSGVRMRIRSWTAFFEEGVLIFWNSGFAKDYKNPSAANIYLGPEERGYIKVLQDITNNLDPKVIQFKLASGSSDIRSYGLKSPSIILGYFDHVTNHETTASTVVNLDLPFDGVVNWIDPGTGNVIKTGQVSKGKQSLTTPEFVVDLAMKIKEK